VKEYDTHKATDERVLLENLRFFVKKQVLEKNGQIGSSLKCDEIPLPFAMCKFGVRSLVEFRGLHDIDSMKLSESFIGESWRLYMQQILRLPSSMFPKSEGQKEALWALPLKRKEYEDRIASCR
jgi:hypothetical protein